MTDSKSTLVIVTQDEPFYMSRYMNSVIRKLGPETELLHVYALPPNLGQKNFLQTVKYYFSFYGGVVFTYLVLLKLWYAVSDILCRYFRTSGRFHSVQLVCREHNVPFSRKERINAEDVISELKALKPDIIFSIASPQIFDNNIISVPRRACLNIHSSLLPEYRGLNANFWVLAKGEKTSGVTIHYINPGIDDGDIVLQKKISIQDDWSLHDMYMKAIDTGSDMIAECLKQMHAGDVTTKKNDISGGSYYSAPAREDVKEFRSRKKRFFKYY